MHGNDGLIWPGWRSLLFVPATNRKLVDKAAGRGADALILDLEDAVADADKAVARTDLAAIIAQLDAQANIVVRVNAGLLALMRDLEAAVQPGLQAVLLPKAETPQRLTMVDELLTELESEAGLPAGRIALIPLVESARGLLNAPELADAGPRITALALGPEDLALDLGGEPVAGVLTEPARRLAWAARASGRVAVGFPGSIANIRDEERLRADLTLARQLGFGAALCIHPDQLSSCHDAFSVSADEAERARRIVTAFERAERQGRAVCVLDGEMIDRPVVLRARAMLARWQQQR
ncbi:CoA ester lyase [Aquisalimonas sp.]|uniref:HpcH/HpaI aldolase/citrate lyase family protein n=1 Tax=Aquisalimonas sp. TaxID=1872621 RepID=UPI0025BEC2D0|nr:CoA ester lyase [Aquisalimonas sp.]